MMMTAKTTSLPQQSGMRRRTWMQQVTGTVMALACGMKAVGQEATSQALDLTKLFAEQAELLNRRYWSPELEIWLDKTGNDLRAFYEGRLNAPWWSCANAVEVLADQMLLTQRKDWLKQMEAMHDRHRENPNHAPMLREALTKRGEWTEQDERRYTRRQPVRRSTKAGFADFCNEYLDDSGWWGLGWLKMHTLTGEAKYLETAKRIQQHMGTHRTADDGIVWNVEQNPQVTNAISNGLYMTLSARLAKVTGEVSYLQEAKRAHAWYVKQKLYDGVGIVDGPGHVGDHWSYNQGMWILGLLALHEVEPEAGHFTAATEFTVHLLDKGGFVKDGVVIEKLSHTGWDTALFKCAFVRALGTLQPLVRKQPLGRRIAELLQGSVSSFLKNSVGKDGEIGLQWQANAEGQEWNFNTQLSAMSAVGALQACGAR